MARITITTTAPESSGSGSLKGIAAQVSLPSMSASCLFDRSTPSRTRARVAGARLRLVDDVLEQIGADRAEGFRRYGRARLRQFGVGLRIQRRPYAAYPFDPGLEISRRHRLRDEQHVRKAIAAEHRGKAGKFARCICQQVEMCGHASHCVDLTTELRDEEGVHHGCRGNLKAHWCARGDDQLIDGGDA